jgi:hypothetical protein
MRKHWKRPLTIAFNVIGTLLILFLVGRTIYSSYVTPMEYKSDGCYTIGTTIGKGFKYRHGRIVYYQYAYKKEVYEGWELLKEDVIVNGGKYLVRVNGKRPHISECYMTDGQVEILDTIHYKICP